MSALLASALIAGTSLVTSFISGILGMAGGMILMGVLLALCTLPVAMMLHGISQLTSNGARAWFQRRSIDLRVVREYAFGAFAAALVLAAFQFVASKPVALVFMGLSPFIGLALPERLHLNVERRGHAFACGAICNVISLTAGLSGPLLDLFFVRSKMGRHAVIATKAASQVLSHLLKIFYFGVLAAGGTAVDPWLAGAMVLCGIVGTSLSNTVLERITDTDFRRWTRWTVLGLGVVYLTTGLASLAG